MFNRFKYLELTSHHALKKAKKFIAESTKKDDSHDDQIIEVIFSSMLTLFISYLVEVYFTVDDKSSLGFWSVAGYMICEIVLYVAFFVIVRYCYRWIRKKYRVHKSNTRVNTPDISPITNKELVDDFDNIAFDNLLVATECLKQIDCMNQNASSQGSTGLDSLDLEVIRFYLHESIYYLRVAVDITISITTPDRRKACLNIRGNTRGVDVFRLINAEQMMSHIIAKIRNIYNSSPNIQGTPSDKWHALLKSKIDGLETDIKAIEAICRQAELDIDRIY